MESLRPFQFIYFIHEKNTTEECSPLYYILDERHTGGYTQNNVLGLHLGETGTHWDKHQSLGPGPKNVNITTSDNRHWESLTYCPWYVLTSTLLCNHGWCENLFKNVSQLSHCAIIRNLLLTTWTLECSQSTDMSMWNHSMFLDFTLQYN